MKKPVKNILGLTAFVAVVVLLSYLENILVPDNTNDPTLRTHYSHLKEQVEQGWKSQQQWEKSLYEFLTKEIKNSFQRGEIKEGSKDELLTLNNSSAIDVILNFYHSEMKEKGCREELIYKNYEGVKTVMNFNNSAANVTTVNEMYSAYKGVMGFVRRNFTRYAEIDSALKWRPYNRESFDREKKNWENNKYYKSHFHNIAFVQDAWNGYEKKVSMAQKAYYSSLASLLRAKLDETQRSIRDKKEQLSDIEHKAYFRAGRERYTKVLDDLLKEIDALSKKWTDVQSRFNRETTSEIRNEHNLFLAELSAFITSAYPAKKEVQGLLDKINQDKQDN